MAGRYSPPVVIGGTSLAGGRSTIAGTVLGMITVIKDNVDQFMTSASKRS